MISSHARRMARARAQLNNRIGATGSYATPAAPATPIAPATAGRTPAATAGGRARRWFRSRLVTVPLILLVVFVGLWLGGSYAWNHWPEFSGSPARQAAILFACPNASSQETRECPVTKATDSWIMAEEGPAVDGMQICYIPAGMVTREEKIVDGTFFVRFRAKEDGQVKARYKLVRLDDGKTCPPI